jgi:alpha-L-rhamnosidase
MKRKIERTTITAVLISLLCLCHCTHKPGSGEARKERADETSLVNLRCEYLSNPVGIDITKPRLSWELQSKQRDQQQAAYRIIVASSLEKLAKEKGDFWDSGRQRSDQSNQVVYDGKPLISRTSCFWKVQTWNNRNQKSSWSSPARWSMGLLDPKDWSAKWISMKQDTFEDQEQTSHNSPMLRKSFTLSKQVKEAQLSICGLGYYELFLNGTKVGDHVLDPTWTCYHKNALYVSYDIADSLHQGGNALGVQLANGVYNQEFPDAWDFHKAPWRAFPQMLLQLDVVYSDGSKEQLVSDESWKVSTGPIYWDQLRMGVMYDARREQPGWSTATFDDSDWEPALLREGIKGELAAQMSEPIKVMKTLSPVSIHKENGVYVFDFGQNIAGWSRLNVSGKAGTTVTMDHGSHALVHGEPLQTEVYTLKGNGQEVWEPGFTYHGFSKVKVSGLPETPDKQTLEARVVHTAFEERGAFECSNSILNKIVEMSRWSYIGNFVGIPTDCPHREKNGWTGDAQIAAELGLIYYGSEAAYTRWMLDFAAIQAADGKLPCIVPTGGWGERFLDGPAWESAYLIIPWHIYEYRGDRRILETHYDNYKRWLEWYRDEARVILKERMEGTNIPGTKYQNPQKVNQGNIIYYGIGDWAGGGDTPFEITSTAYYYNAAKIISSIAHLLGKSVEEKEYADLAAEVRIAFNKAFMIRRAGPIPMVHIPGCRQPSILDWLHQETGSG